MRRLVAALLVCLAVDARAQTTDHGSAFYALDAEATRVITWFEDSYAITERGANQHLQTRLFNRRASAVLATADYAVAEEGRPATWRGKIGKVPVAVEQAAAPKRHTAWANTQLRELWLDQRARAARGATAPPELSSHRGVWRMNDVVGARRSPGAHWAEDTDVEAIATEYGSAMAVVSRDVHGEAAQGRGTARSTFSVRMFDAGGRVVGWLRWFEKERVLTWSFPNGRRGTVMESNVPGGFKFTPSMAWANVQALGFLKQSGRGTPGLPSGGAARWAPASMPAGLDGLPVRGPNAGGLEAQSGCDGGADGCTGLHFLDGSIFEECCTKHDLCYERDAPGDCCEAWSWLVPNPFWHCARCNFAAVWCFITRPQPEPDWDEGPLRECERQSYADWCAPECASCRTREDSTSRN